MRIESVGRSRYFLLFTDDYSRFSWVSFLKFKLETFKNFKIFKAFAENQRGKKLKALRTDRGGEFLSNEFMCSAMRTGCIGNLQHFTHHSRIVLSSRRIG